MAGPGGRPITPAKPSFDGGAAIVARSLSGPTTMLILQRPPRDGSNGIEAELDRWRTAWSDEARELLESPDPAPSVASRLLDLAHAARQVAEGQGTPRQRAAGSWQVARAYGSIGQPGLALAYAEEALSLVESHHLADLLVSALEGVARAHATGGRRAEASEAADRARRALRELSWDAEERAILEAQLVDTERLIARLG